MTKKKTKIALVGPVAVGKTTVSIDLAEKLGIDHIDYDEYRRTRGETLTGLDLQRSLAPILENRDSFLLDIGGDTVFRSSADNEDRLKQALSIKNSHNVDFIMLRADEEALTKRYVDSGSSARRYGAIFNEWHTIAEPKWRQVVDPELVIETSGKNPDAIVKLIIAMLRERNSVVI